MTRRELRDKKIAERVEGVKNKRTEIKRIAAELYLSERAVYYILKRFQKSK